MPSGLLLPPGSPSNPYLLEQIMLRIGSVILLLFTIPSCVHMQKGIDPTEMAVRGSALTKLSSAMQAYVRYTDPLPDLSESALLAEGTKHDPALLANLGDYKLRLLVQDRHVVVLMCTRAGDRALLEDAGCTGMLETHRWKQEAAPCEFSSAIKACDTR
jgi:hypothetical protein